MAEHSKKTKLNPSRNYGIDFLRILSMLFILLLHILKQGGILSSYDKFTLGYNLAWFVEVCAYCAVNCYALISGYIGYTSKHKYSSIINLYFQTAFYALLSTGIFYFVSPNEVDNKALVRAVFPFGFNLYWYFTAYFCMFFFIPFMNKILEVCNKKQLTGLIVALLTFFSVMPLVFKSDLYFTNNGYSVLWLSILYIIGGYIRKYDLQNKFSNIKCVLLYFAGVFISFGQKVLVELLKYKITGEIVSEGVFIKYNSLTMVLCAVSLLCLFAKVNFMDGIKKLIAFFSPFTFGVYLVQTAPFVWSKVMKNRFVSYADLNPFLMVLAVLGTAIGIFALCSLVDFLRLQIFKLCRIKELSVLIEKTITKIISKLYREKSEKDTEKVI